MRKFLICMVMASIIKLSLIEMQVPEHFETKKVFHRNKGTKYEKPRKHLPNAMISGSNFVNGKFAYSKFI